jgi:hypothetical protein
LESSYLVTKDYHIYEIKHKCTNAYCLAILKGSVHGLATSQHRDGGKLVSSQYRQDGEKEIRPGLLQFIGW